MKNTTHITHHASRITNLLIVTPIFPPDIGGPATYVSELASRLSPSCTVRIVTFAADIPKTDTSHPYRLTRIPVGQPVFKRQWQLAQAIRNAAGDCSCIYVQGTLTVGMAVALIGKIRSKKIVLKFVGDEVWEAQQAKQPNREDLDVFYSHPHDTVTSIKILLHRLVLRLADQIIVPSGYLKQFLVKYHHLPESKITVIPNPIEIPAQVKKATKRPSDQTTRLIFVGRLVPWKHVDEIIEAVAIARGQHPWTLTIVGDGPEREYLEHFTPGVKPIKDHSRSEWLQFTGQLSKLETLRLIAQSRALILYSSYEGHPHTILEAHALGIPTIASNIPPHKSLGCCQLVDAHNPQALADAIKSLDKKSDWRPPPKPPPGLTTFSQYPNTWRYLHESCLSKPLEWRHPI